MEDRKSDIYYYNLVRSNIRKFRLEKNFTQAKLADEANLSVDYICEIESMKKNKSFSIATVGKIAEALDVDFHRFFEWLSTSFLINSLQLYTDIFRHHSLIKYIVGVQYIWRTRKISSIYTV